MGNVKRILHMIAMLALIAPFLLLSSFSSSVMVVRADTGPTLVICTGEGPLEIVFDPVTGDPIQKQPGDGHDQCVWANAHDSVTPQTPFVAPQPTGLALNTDRAAAPFVLRSARATGLPPSTGPPPVL